jgi:hypothetical protein
MYAQENLNNNYIPNLLKLKFWNSGMSIELIKSNFWKTDRRSAQ